MVIYDDDDDDDGEHIYYDFLGDDQLTSVTSPTMGMLKRRRQPWMRKLAEILLKEMSLDCIDSHLL